MRLFPCAVVLFLAAHAAAQEPESGFRPLLNGKDLTGWRTQGKAGAPLDGKADAHKGRFSVKDGVLVIDPAVKGDVRIETAEAFGPGTTIRFEFRPGPGCNNDLFLLGSKFDINPAQLKGVKLGEWNTLEIAAAPGVTTFRVNGETARTDKDKAKAEKTVFEIRAEFGPVEIRNLRVKTGP